MKQVIPISTTGELPRTKGLRPSAILSLAWLVLLTQGVVITAAGDWSGARGCDGIQVFRSLSHYVITSLTFSSSCVSKVLIMAYLSHDSHFEQ